MNNVLIIEDDKEICVMIKDHLEKYNYQVFFTLTGANAIERIKELSPDLIILDLMLPFISGDELIRNIRKFSDVDDFYQISLLEAGQYPFYYEKVELCSLLTEILLDNYSIFSVNGIEPQIEIPNMDIYLNADRKACIRIIQNLIFNAVTSTTNNVVIQLINIADSVQLCIKNPVASIPTEEYSKLLERFYVADVSRSNGTSGQGLYIVKKLLLMMNCTNPIIEIHDHNFMITIDFSPLLIKK